MTILSVNTDNITNVELNVPYHVMIENCIVSWGGNLFTPQTNPGKETPEYSITVFTHRDNPAFQKLAYFTKAVRSKYPVSLQNKGYQGIDMVQSSPQRLQSLFTNFIKAGNQEDHNLLVSTLGLKPDIEEYFKIIAKNTDNSHVVTAGTSEDPVTFQQDPKLFYEGTIVSISYYLTFYPGRAVEGQQQQFFCKRTLENVHYVHPGFSKYRENTGGTGGFSAGVVKKPRFFKTQIIPQPRPEYMTSVNDDQPPF